MSCSEDEMAVKLLFIRIQGGILNHSFFLNCCFVLGPSQQAVYDLWWADANSLWYVHVIFNWSIILRYTSVDPLELLNVL